MNSGISIEEFFLIVGKQAVRIYILEKQRDELAALLKQCKEKLGEKEKV